MKERGVSKQSSNNNMIFIYRKVNQKHFYTDLVSLISLKSKEISDWTKEERSINDNDYPLIVIDLTSLPKHFSLRYCDTY